MRCFPEFVPAVPADRARGHAEGVWRRLERRVDEFRHESGLPVDLLMHVADGVQAPDGAHAQAIAAIVDEAFANIVQHAYAQNVRIRVAVDPPPQPVLYLVISDDGIGTTAEAMTHVAEGGLARMQGQIGRAHV